MIGAATVGRVRTCLSNVVSPILYGSGGESLTSHVGAGGPAAAGAAGVGVADA